MTVRDTTALGALSGVLAAIPQLIFDFLSVQLGFSQFFAFQLSGSIYLFPKLTEYIAGLVLGGLIWFSMSAFLGIVTAYLIKITGIDYWWLKGLVVSNVLMFTIMYGFLFNLGGAKIVPFDISTNLTVYLSNVIFGLTTSYLIVRWGKQILVKR